MENTQTQSGYTPCACRDCFDVAVSSDVDHPELCNDCEAAGCEPNDGECSRDDAYGVEFDQADFDRFRADPKRQALVDRILKDV